MQPDSMGFLYPKVDSSRCVECGKCETVCSFSENYDISLNLPEPIAYGARQHDLQEVIRSRSGAVFAVLSDYILDNGGVVYGAGYAEHFRVVHKRAETKALRDEFRGSKYVQSDMNTVFRQVRQDLKNGRTVLFSGTPCQTSGLNSYVGKKLRKGLVLVDLICHGTPSPYVWRDYLAYQEKKYGVSARDVDFRDKVSFGWSAHRESIFLDNDRRINPDWYSKTFCKRIMFRPSCSICHFCNLRRPSDITLGDFWGWQKQDSDINKDDLGLNLVLVNTEMGKQCFEAIKDKLQIIPADKENYLQPNLIHPSVFHPSSKHFEKDYVKHGFTYVYNNPYAEHPLWKRALSKGKRLIIRILKINK